MSDFEEVKLTQAQFQEWLSQATAQKNGLNRIAEAIIGLKESRLEQKIDRLIELLETGGHIPDLGFINAKLDLIQGLIENEGPITNLTRKVDEFMATQEERLRGVKTKLDAIQSGVDKIQQQLADLKVNNPELEDEIAAIEATAAAIDTDVNPAVVTEPPA